MSLSIGQGLLSGLAGTMSGLLPRIRVTVPALAGLLAPQAPALDPRLHELAGQIAKESNPFFHDNGILLAAPKKRVSYSKKRAKLYAPGNKQVKKIESLNRCPSCGHIKRAHTLCMHCYFEIKNFLRAKKAEENPAPKPYEQELSEQDRRILYPGRRESSHDRRLKDKDWIKQRPRSLPYEE